MSDLKTTLHNNLPLRMAYGWLKRKIKHPSVWYEEEFVRTHQELLETQWWSREKLEALQLEKLQALVRHAYTNVPYYQQLFDGLGMTPDDIQSLSDLARLPILTKQTIRDNFDAMVARNVPPERLHYVTTGGSTGKPLGLYHDHDTAPPREDAFRFRMWDWAGYHYGDRVVTLRGAVVSAASHSHHNDQDWWNYNSDDNELVLSSMSLDESHLDSYVEKIRQFQPRFIQAYPSSIEILARYIQRTGITNMHVEAVFCESETLYPEQRALIEKAFNTRIFAGYGHTERTVDAIECEQHNGYHVSMEYGILELVDENHRPITEPGVTGLVVGTGFDTYCMPLIRYETDDRAVFAPEACACGRELVLIQEFKGRVKEYLISKTGQPVPLTAAYSALHTPILNDMRELQFVQEQPGEVVIKVVKAASADAAGIEGEFLRLLRERLLPGDFNVSIEFVDQLTRTSRGKLSLLDQKIKLDFEYVNKSPGTAR